MTSAKGTPIAQIVHTLYTAIPEEREKENNTMIKLINTGSYSNVGLTLANI